MAIMKKLYVNLCPVFSIDGSGDDGYEQDVGIHRGEDGQASQVAGRQRQGQVGVVSDRVIRIFFFFHINRARIHFVCIYKIKLYRRKVLSAWKDGLETGGPYQIIIHNEKKCDVNVILLLQIAILVKPYPGPLQQCVLMS
jgi:hypothetical protein